MKAIELVCADCAKLAKCKSAPDNADSLLEHTCDRWEPLHSAIVSARQNIYNRFGAASRDGFRKKEKLMKPDAIINAVNTGDVSAIEALKTQEINPVNLMLAAATVDKSAGGEIAEQYRALAGDDDARRLMLIEKLIANAKSVKASENPPASAEEKPKRKRRARRQTPEVESQPELPTTPTEADKEAAKAEFVKDAQPKESPIEGEASAVALLNLLREVSKGISALDAKVTSLDARVEAIEANSTSAARIVESLADEVGKIKRNMTRAKAGLNDFEAELIISGTVGSTPFLNNTEGWED